MLTEFVLRNLKPRTAPYKIPDRDGMYVGVSPAGTISFRYDYRINGRRETLIIGRYGRGGISVGVGAGKTDGRPVVPSVKAGLRQWKNRGKSSSAPWQRPLVNRLPAGLTAPEWRTTRSVRKGIVVRDILPAFKGRLLCEVTADDLRALRAS